MTAALASEVKRVAQERHVTISRALVVLAERGVRAEAEAKAQLKASYRRIVRDHDDVGLAWNPDAVALDLERADCVLACLVAV